MFLNIFLLRFSIQRRCKDWFPDHRFGTTALVRSKTLLAGFGNSPESLMRKVVQSIFPIGPHLVSAGMFGALVMAVIALPAVSGETSGSREHAALTTDRVNAPANPISNQAFQAKLTYCEECHGSSARGFRGYYPIPRLAGQQIEYLENQLRAFVERRRKSNIMFDVSRVAC